MALMPVMFLLVSSIVFAALLMESDVEVESEVDKAVAECEAEIPRNQTCGYKIVTFVKEGGE